MNVWSCGGGRQSAAIAALILLGRLPRPDLALIVDTGRERSSTWAYLEDVLRPAMGRVNLDITRVFTSELATVDLYAGNGDVLLPGFTNRNGAVGKLPGYCSNEWKRRVLSRYLRKCGVDECVLWLGISTDELRRVRTPTEAWLQLRYPLIFDVPMSASDCKALVAKMGWPMPSHSSCWMCPNQSDGEWQTLKRDWPEDFAQAMNVEVEIRQRDPHFYLHEACVPLSEVDFDAQRSMFPENGCSSGYCFS